MSREFLSLLVLAMVLPLGAYGQGEADGENPAPLALESAVREALGANPELGAAKAETRAALEAAGLAGAVEHGEWRFSGAAGYTDELNADPVYWFSHWGITNELRRVLDDGGRSSAAHAEALARVVEAQAVLDRTASQLTFEVAEAFLEVLRAQRAARLYTEGEALVAEHLRMALALRESGAASELDVLRAQSDLSSAHAATVGGVADLERARLALARLLGRDQSGAGRIAVADVPAGDVLPPEIAGPLEPVLARAPEVRAAEAEVAIAEAGIDLANSAYEVELDLLLSHAFDTDRTDSRHIIQAGVEWDLPLSGHGAKGYRRRQADELRSVAQRRLEGTRAVVEEAIRNAVIQVEAASARLESAAEAARYAGVVHRLADEGYQEGAVSMRDLLDARMDYTLAEIERVRAEADLAIAHARLLQYVTPVDSSAGATPALPDEGSGGTKDGATDTPQAEALDAPDRGSVSRTGSRVGLRPAIGRR